MSRYRAATALLDGYVHESTFLRADQSPDHRIVWASEGFETIFGCTVDEYNRGQIWGGLYHPEDAQAAVLRAAALRRGETVEAELRMFRKDGTLHWLYVKNQPIVDTRTKKITGVLGVGLDITRRKLAEQSQRRTDSILTSVTRSDPDWLLLLDAQMKVQFINRPFPAEHSTVVVGRPLFECLDVRDRARLALAVSSVLDGGAPTVVEGRASVPAAAECLEIRTAPVREDAGITGLAVRITDISARKHDEETLRTHAIILETMDEGVILFDAAGTICHSNLAAQRMFGMEAAALARTPVERLGIRYLIGPRGGGHTQATRRSMNPEALCARADGTHFVARLAFTEIELREQAMVIAVLHDATEQKNLEQEIIDIANREQQRIAVDLHDGLGQELTGVALLLRSLAQKNAYDSPQITLSIEEVIGLVNRAISEVRTLARGLSPVELERGGLSVALSALATRMRDASKIDVRFKSHAPRTVMPAPVANHLYRIAQEAVANALRHSEAKSIRISLASRDDGLVLSITDDGLGITRRPSSKSGMGLHIMDYRARMIGAQVTIQSPSEGGTTVLCRMIQTGT